MARAPELMALMAPTINSYKRYQDDSFAPTRVAWSYDNRTAGFRVVGHDQSLRIECRIPTDIESSSGKLNCAII